jgi:hypothetical protein
MREGGRQGGKEERRRGVSFMFPFQQIYQIL